MFRTWSHGTRCTGQIAMEANNTVCGVGLIPLTTVGGDAFSDCVLNTINQFFLTLSYLQFISSGSIVGSEKIIGWERWCCFTFSLSRGMGSIQLMGAKWRRPNDGSLRKNYGGSAENCIYWGMKSQTLVIRLYDIPTHCEISYLLARNLFQKFSFKMEREGALIILGFLYVNW